WWGLVAGLGEGFFSIRSQPWVWHDVLRAATIFEPVLFFAVPLIAVLIRPRLTLNKEALLKINFVFAGLTLLDWARVAWPLEQFAIAALGAVAAAAVVAFLLSTVDFWIRKLQRRALPLLLILAIWAIVAVPIKQHRHESRELARLIP